MGIDLDFIAQGKQKNFIRDYRIFSQMSGAFEPEDGPKQSLFPRRLPLDHPDHDMQDGYGKISYLTAKEIREKLSIPLGANSHNKQIKKWIDSLPDDEKVILFWH